MNLREFAQTHCLRLRRDEAGEPIIPGKLGHIWEYGEGLLAVTFLDLTVRLWNARKRVCLAAGMELRQDGDREGTLTFDPADSEQVRVALKAAGVKRKRVPSPAQLAVLARARNASPLVRTGGFSGGDARGEPGPTSDTSPKVLEGSRSLKWDAA